MSIKNTADSFNELAGFYEKKWEGYLKNTHQKLWPVLEIQEGDSVLDVSAGTGLLAQQILEEFSIQKLILNDISSEMQSLAKSRLAEYENIEYTSSSAEALDFEPGSFDHIISLNAYHNYPRQNEFLVKVFEWLKPGASLYILDWNRRGLFRFINWYISLTVNEIINTRSLPEVLKQLKTTGFSIELKREWKYNYWNLFLIKCQKPE